MKADVAGRTTLNGPGESPSRRSISSRLGSARIGRALSNSPGAGPLILIAAVLMGVVIAATLVSSQPLIAAAVVAAPFALVLFVRSARFRLSWFVLGAIIVFQLPDSLTSLKLVYFGGVVLSVAVGLSRLNIAPNEWLVPFRSIRLPAILFLVILALGTTIGLQGNDSTVVFKDVLPYLLVLVSPVIGLDAARDVKPRGIYVLMGLFGLLSAIGFALDWLDRRGISNLPVGKVVLSTLVLGGLGFAAAVVLLRSSKSFGRLGWIFLIAAIPVAYIITGTRTAITLVVIVVAAIGSRRKSRTPLGGLLVVAAILALALSVILPAIASVVITDPTYLTTRIQSLFDIFSYGAQADQSGQERLESYGLALQQWQASPILGSGPGHVYPNDLINLDTPLMILAKWGVLGTIVMVAFVASIAYAGWRSGRLYGHSPATTISRAFMWFAVALTPFIPIFEDKGLALALALIIAALASEARVRSATALDPAASTATEFEPTVASGARL